MSAQPDYYALLGVLREATQDEIKRAYFEAAQRLHPDKNKAVGETEFFLEIQQAYEVLSDPRKRAKYDAALPPEEVLSGQVAHKILYSRQSLVHLDEAQLVYVLLELMPGEAARQMPAPPLNVCLVLDRSTSMQGAKMDVVKAAALQLLRRLRPQDIFGVIIFSDRAEVLIPSARQADKSKLEARIRMLQTSGSTEIYQGLEAGVNQVRQHRDPARINHLILLTDGHTYGDEQACLTLGSEAAAQGIGVSGFGIGQDWNDAFLDLLAIQTGGSSTYVSMPQDIQRLLMEKFNHLAQAFADETTLDFKSQPGVSLSYAFRIQPEAGPLPLDSPLRLGPILQDTPLNVIFEFMIQPSAVQNESVHLIEGALKVAVASQPTPLPPIRLRLSRPVADSVDPEPPPQTIIQALSRLTLYRMQEKAHAEVEAGKYGRASQRLQHLATHLLAQGERGLARTALLEAESIQQMRAFSKEGHKQIKYGTRALLAAGGEGQVR